MPRYGSINEQYMASWFRRDEPGGPMWALNLMKYRKRAEYADGRESTRSGIEADNEYAPFDHLAAVGSKVVLLASVTHQLVGDDWQWDRIAIAQYRDRFRKSEEHKDAGMEFSIVLASFPTDDPPAPPEASGAGDDRLLLLQIVGDPAAPDLAADVESTRIGRFDIEDRIIGDDRTFAEARFDLIAPAAADALAAAPTISDPNAYAVIADPVIDEVARSLADPTTVQL